MKRLSLTIVFVMFFALLPVGGVHAALGDALQGAFFSAFRNAQVLVEGVRTKVTRLLGIRGEAPLALPSLRIFPFPDVREFLIGTEREIRWTYQYLRESVTRVTLFPEGRPRTLLMFLPAKRNTSGSDVYSFPVRFDRGTYRIQVCNGETCDMTEPFSIVFATSEERGRYVRGAENPALFFEYWVQYTSPSAAAFAFSTERFLEEYGDKSQILVKQLPSDIRPASLPHLSSLAALCAAGQDLAAFWKAHEALLSNRGFSREYFYAVMQGAISFEKFEACLQGGDALRILESFIREAEHKNVFGPGAFLRTSSGGEVWLPETASFEEMRVLAERLLRPSGAESVTSTLSQTATSTTP